MYLTALSCSKLLHHDPPGDAVTAIPRRDVRPLAAVRALLTRSMASASCQAVEWLSDNSTPSIRARNARKHAKRLISTASRQAKQDTESRNVRRYTQEPVRNCFLVPRRQPLDATRKQILEAQDDRSALVASRAAIANAFEYLCESIQCSPSTVGIVAAIKLGRTYKRLESRDF